MSCSISCSMSRTGTTRLLVNLLLVSPRFLLLVSLLLRQEFLLHLRLHLLQELRLDLLGSLLIPGTLSVLTLSGWPKLLRLQLGIVRQFALGTDRR